MIEVQDVIDQRLSRTVGEKAASVTANGIRQAAAGRLKMALHADFELPLAAQPCGIYDRAARGTFGVCAAGTVAALAIDGWRDRAGQAQFPLRSVRHVGIRVVAEEAF